MATKRKPDNRVIVLHDAGDTARVQSGAKKRGKCPLCGLRQRLKAKQRPKPKTWLDKLTPDELSEVLAMRADYQAGEFSHLTKRDIYEDVEASLGDRVAARDTFSRWLEERP